MIILKIDIKKSEYLICNEKVGHETAHIDKAGHGGGSDDTGVEAQKDAEERNAGSE